MAEMVFLRCDIGSKAALVVCPECGKITMQILKSEYRGDPVNCLASAHICTVCGSTYTACSDTQAANWTASERRYNLNSSAYNSAIKDTYARRKAEAIPTTRSRNLVLLDYWEDLFTDVILKRGHAYFIAGKYAVTENNRAMITGIVYGEKDYKVLIPLRDGSIDEDHLSCTCPYFSERGERCKHIAALLYATIGVKRESASKEPVQRAAISPLSTGTPSSSDSINAIQDILKHHIADVQTDEQVENQAQDRLVKAGIQKQPEYTSADQDTKGPTGMTIQNSVFDEHPNNISGFAEGNQLERRISRWKKELLDTGKRNRMINYRETKRSTLRILKPSPEELFNKLAFSDKPLKFEKPINKDTDFRTYAMLALMETLSYNIPVYDGDIKADGTIVEREKTLKNLRSKTKLAREEQGTNILYLSFGFILWREKDKPNSQWLKAPLLMMPVTLSQSSLKAPFTLSQYDDDIEVNPTLDYLFNAEYGIDLPTFEPKNKDSFDEYMMVVEQLIDKKGWKLIREVSLGLLSFLKISMYHDINNDANHQLIVNSPVLRAIGGDYTAIKDLPPQAQNFDFDQVRPQEWYQVINSDSSQQEAILLSKLGVSFVMQGPPGTGKSQTITNIIAEALADGKKVLFVSEKAAALQVVLKRLTEARLDDFCLSLHNYKANKKEIVQNIGANLSQTKSAESRTAMRELTQLMRDRQYLNEYAEELHRVIEPFGESIYSAYGRAAQFGNATNIEFSIDNIADITKDQFLSMLYNIELFERALRSMGALSANPWSGSTVSQSGQIVKAQILSDTSRLNTDLDELCALIAKTNDTYHLQISNNMPAVISNIALIKEALELPICPEDWLDKSKFTYLLETANHEKLRQEEFYKKLSAFKELYVKQADEGELHSRQLSDAYTRLREMWTDSVFDLDLSKISGHFELAYASTPDDTTPVGEAIQNASSKSSRVLMQTSGMLDTYKSAVKMLCLDVPADINGFTKLSQIVSILKDAPYMETSWFDPRQNVDIKHIIDEARRHEDTITAKKAAVLENWEIDILSLDADAMLARFKTEYGGMFHKIKSAYKEDMKQLKLLAKKVGVQISEEDAVQILQAIKDINSEKRWFADNEGMLIAIFKSQYYGLDTDWSKLDYGVSAALQIANFFPYSNIPEEVIAAIQAAIGSPQKAAELRRFTHELSAQAIENCMEAILGLGYIEGFIAATLLDGTAIPAMESFISNCIEQNKYLSAITSCLTDISQGYSVTYGDITRLIKVVKAIRSEKDWFDGKTEVLTSLYADAYVGEKTNWTAIRSDMSIEHSLEYRQWQDEFAAEAQRLLPMFGERYVGVGTDWGLIIEELEQVLAFEPKQRLHPLGMEFMKEMCGNQELRSDLLGELSLLTSKADEITPKFSSFVKLFGNEVRAMPLPEISKRYSACMSSFEDLEKWIDYKETKADCDKIGLLSFTEQIAKVDNSIHDVKDAFERYFYQQWILMAQNEVPAVQSFKKRIHEQHLDDFTKEDVAQFEIAKSRIRERIISTFPDSNAMTRARSELAVLKHEMAKKQRIMPLRKLFRSIPNLLLTLKPCLMMSPLSVAYFLEADSYHFDMVIFDEASQIFPQDAIGAIFRANQVVIAGDTKQLPPTNFFSASTSNDSDYDDNNEEDWDNEIYDSILEETANILPNRTLLWHYRSKHEHLISFSNHEIYQNDLVTFPSSSEKEPDTGVEFVYVKDGFYEPKPRNYNKNESLRCVELVKEHIENHPERSLGIIAFSESQQQAILMEIQKFREKNPKYEPFFAEDKEEEFFVKNLENVQGDERDTIFFSIGYAKTKEQSEHNKPMTMRFGPLGVQGGERRLNVAITRAKINIKLISSILPSDIDLSRTESEGVRMLRSYIEFAMNGGATLSSAHAETKTDDFEKAIAEFLRSNGYKIREHVGCSGYRIDIAIEHPDREDEFIAGIECDGLSYVSARTARDRDRLRGSVLTSMGWNLYRVWSSEWYKNQEIESKRLLDFIKGALEASNIKAEKTARLRKAEADKKRKAFEQEQAELELAERKRLEEEQRIADNQKQLLDRARKVDADRKARAALEAEERQQAHNEARARQEAQKKERERSEEATRIRPDLSWVKIGTTIAHKSFGNGVVTKTKPGSVFIQFSVGEKQFSVPSAFDMGFLKKASNTEDKTRQTVSDSNQAKGKRMLDALVRAGFICIDNSDTSSILWVLYDAGKRADFEKIVSEYTVKCSWEKRGSLATNNKPAWRIML